RTSAEVAVPQTPAPTAPVPALNVILVEPSRTQSAIIRRHLQGQGVQNIVTAANGREALQAVRSERRDVVVCALHLSDMTGLQLAEQIRREIKTAPPGFVLISSEAESEGVGSLSRFGKAILLKKPFTAPQLGEALRFVSGSSEAASKGRSLLRVLIVDDSAAARVHFRGVLTGLGLSQFVEASDGARAVAAVAGDHFDLIITDYNMPY